MAGRPPLQGLPGGIPLVGNAAQPQTQNVVVDAFDNRGNPIKLSYPVVAVSFVSDELLANIAKTVTAMVIMELDRRGVLPPPPVVSAEAAAEKPADAV